MCYYVDQKSSRNDAKIRFNIAVSNTRQYYEGVFVNGFSYPNLPIITTEKPDIITTDHTWGLLPSWTKDIDFRKNTLNARIETINEKTSYKNITQNRCLIVATGFYEWRWLDEKGKSKEKYHISSQTDEIFCFAGLYDKWVNPATGEVFNTYTMVTSEANELMQYIHNHKKRMPVILNREDEKAWLDPANNISDFALPCQAKLIAFPTK
jgi:putative SOS response-associated peptidase YedK